MIRIASDFFIPVFGSELIKDFETATAEPEIEDIYKVGYNFQVFIMNSENFIAYVFVDQIRPLLDEMYKAFPNVPYSPCNAYKDYTIQQIVRYTDIPYKKYDVEDKTKLHEIWKDIYKHYIE